jgi:hypothetical protein
LTSLRYFMGNLCYCPCLFNEVWGMSGVFCAVPCLCNEVWGMSVVKTSLNKHGQ